MALKFLKLTAFVNGIFGGRAGTRTLDPLIKSQLLYQLSYAPGSSFCNICQTG